jgi:PAS domain S-box-containing protein
MDDDGSLWLGASNGASRVFAQHYTGPPSPPRTSLLAGELGHHSVVGALGAAGLEVPHDSNSLRLEIAAGTLLDAKRIEYAMRLGPIETRWSTLREPIARYPALPPGSYHFETRARIGAGPWGPVTALPFVVLPAWWQTGWFLALAGAGVLIAIGAAFAWRQRAILGRRMRQLHARSDASLRAVIDLMPDLISVHRDGQVIYLNRASRRLLGGDAELAARIHPEDAPRIAELFRKVASVDAQAVPEVIELRVRAGDASWRTCEVSAVVVDSGGAPTIVMSGRDVTERKRMRAKLMVSDRMASLGTLAAGIAHEINNPLSYVTGNLEVAAEAMADPAVAPSAARAELAAVIADAREGAERVRKIVDGLRALSRAEDEKRVPVSPHAVLEAAIRLTANEIRHRARLERALGPVPHVIADDGRLTQVFINLLVNAAHAVPEGHTDAHQITVRTRTDDQGRAVIEIEDTGRGMAPDVQSRVFDPFFTTKDVGEGTGLGLSICHGIVTGLGGQIAIESTVGKGTVVRVVLPGHAELAAPPAPAIAPAAAPSVAVARRHRVMLVDDEPQVAQTIERLLRRDYDVTIALCGRDALDHITRGARFDAIISDVMMPNMTGVELIEELQRLAPDQAQRLIFLSGGAFTAHTRERLEQIGAPQLAKPVTIKELRAWVTRIAVEANPQAA